eukprot:gene13643-9772_t
MANKDLGCLTLIGRDRLAGLSGTFPDEIGLSAGRTIVGRSNKADIKLSAERDGKFIISRSHAAIVVNEEAKTVEIEDLGALNGIFVNEVRVKTAFLHDGDVIQFGGMSEVPIGKRLTGGDLSVCYVFREPGSTSQSLNLPQRPSPPSARSDSLVSSANRSAPSTRDDRFPQKRHAVVPGDAPSAAGPKTPAEATVAAAASSSNKRRRTSPDAASASKAATESVKSTPASIGSGSDRKASAAKSAGASTSAESAPRAPPSDPPQQASPAPVAPQCVTLRIPAASFVPGLQLSKESEIASLLAALKEQQAEHAGGLRSLQSAASDWRVDRLQRQSALQSALEQQRQELREELREALGALRGELAAQLAQLVGAVREARPAEPPAPTRDGAAATCPICRELFLDACVLRCSHSLCFLCAAAWLVPAAQSLDEHRRRHFGAKRRSPSTAALTCPLCDAALARADADGDGDDGVAGLRCAALDDAAFSAAQGDAAARQRYEERREAAFRVQRRFRSDELRRLQRLLPSPALMSGAADDRDARAAPSATAGPGDGDGDGDGAANEASDAPSDGDDELPQRPLCDYCGERGHRVARCPHNALRRRGPSDGDDGDEDGDEDGDADGDEDGDAEERDM